MKRLLFASIVFAAALFPEAALAGTPAGTGIASGDAPSPASAWHLANLLELANIRFAGFTADDRGKIFITVTGVTNSLARQGLALGFYLPGGAPGAEPSAENLAGTSRLRFDGTNALRGVFTPERACLRLHTNYTETELLSVVRGSGSVWLVQPWEWHFRLLTRLVSTGFYLSGWNAAIGSLADGGAFGVWAGLLPLAVGLEAYSTPVLNLPGKFNIKPSLYFDLELTSLGYAVVLPYVTAAAGFIWQPVVRSRDGGWKYSDCRYKLVLELGVPFSWDRVDPALMLGGELEWKGFLAKLECGAYLGANRQFYDSSLPGYADGAGHFPLFYVLSAGYRI